MVSKDYLMAPELHRTLSGDGVATMVASFLGGPPNTTYSKVTGAVALLKNYDPILMRIAAVAAILLAFLGKTRGYSKNHTCSCYGRNHGLAVRDDCSRRYQYTHSP